MKALLVALLLLAACAPRSTMLIEVEVHPYKLEFKAPSTYRVWFSQMKACSKGAKRDWAPVGYEALRFVMVEDYGTGFRVQGLDEQLAGYYDARHARIYLIQEGMLTRSLVGHEMLHALGFAHNAELFGHCGVQV